MMQRIERMSRSQRIFIFVLIFGGGLLLLVAITVFLILVTLNTAPRETAVAVAGGVTVREFATLPGEDAYPATVAVGPDGTVYTASYDTGAVWAIDPSGTVVEELPGTRENIGSVTGLAATDNGTLYVVDRLDSDPRAAGGMLWRIGVDGFVTEFGAINDETGFVAPDDITLDAAGNVYVSDRGRREVWRFDQDGDGTRWWVPDDSEVLPTGLAYDRTTETIIITDSEVNVIYRVSLDGTSTEIVYRFSGEGEEPGFDGVTMSPEGAIYVAAFGARSVVRVDSDGITTLAQNFRGAIDVAYAESRLYVTNFDQQSLIVPGLSPQLPFALDMIEFERGQAAG